MLLTSTPAILLALAIPLGFLALLFTVSLVEKRLTHPYLAVAPDRQVALPPYAANMSAQIHAAGFEYGGIVAHAKYPAAKILGTVWFSPARETAVLTGSGTLSGLPVRQTWLFTPLADGRLLVTTDQNDEGDHSGLLLYRRKLNSGFPGLLNLHQTRIDSHLQEVRSFAEPTPAEALLALYRRRTEHLISLGRAHWIDPDELCWRYNVFGALRVCGNFFVQLAAAVPQSWRVHIPRAAPTGPGHNEQVQSLFEGGGVYRVAPTSSR